MIKLFWSLVCAYAILRGTLYAFQYRGSSSPALRARVERHFGEDDIQRGFEYARRGFTARLTRAALDLALLLILLHWGLFARLSDRCLAWTGGKWYLQAPLAVALLLLAVSVLHLPWNYYLGHVLEHRFGFSTQTAAGWLLVQLKDLLVTALLAVLASLLWFGLLRLFPRGWVAVVPAAFGLVQLALALVMPLLLVPLYYRRSPLEEGPFRERVVTVLQRAGIDPREIYVIDESRYSRHTNAFFAGLGPTKTIYLYDTLLVDHPPEEALTVVAHEAGHWRGRHVLKGVLLGAALLLAGCLFLTLLYPSFLTAGAAGWRPLVDPGSLPSVLVLALVGNFFVSPVVSAVSRSFEREADRAAVELTGETAAFVEGEKRLARTNHSQLLPHPLVVFWFYSHPPAVERVEAALASER